MVSEMTEMRKTLDQNGKEMNEYKSMIAEILQSVKVMKTAPHPGYQYPLLPYSAGPLAMPPPAYPYQPLPQQPLLPQQLISAPGAYYDARHHPPPPPGGYFPAPQLPVPPTEACALVPELPVPHPPPNISPANLSVPPASSNISSGIQAAAEAVAAPSSEVADAPADEVVAEPNAQKGAPESTAPAPAADELDSNPEDLRLSQFDQLVLDKQVTTPTMDKDKPLTTPKLTLTSNTRFESPICKSAPTMSLEDSN